jgi:hypothetical protein
MMPRLPLMGRIALVAGILLLAELMGAAKAQGPSSSVLGRGGPPIVGGTIGLRPPARSPFLREGDYVARRHLNPTGKPCLIVNGEAHAQVVNPKIFEHIILAVNTCAQVIKFKICYYKAQHCLTLEAPAYAKKQAVLGIVPSMKDFRFEYTELF